MPSINYLNSKLKFWSNENNEPFHIRIMELSGNNSIKVWIKKDDTLEYSYDGSIPRNVLNNGIDGIMLNLARLKQMYCNHFGIDVTNIKYKE